MPQAVEFARRSPAIVPAPAAVQRRPAPFRWLPASSLRVAPITPAPIIHSRAIPQIVDQGDPADDRFLPRL